MEGFPMEMTVTVTFEDIGGNKTKMILRHSGVESVSDKDRDNMRQGWNRSFDKLEQSLAKT